MIVEVPNETWRRLTVEDIDVSTPAPITACSPLAAPTRSTVSGYQNYIPLISPYWWIVETGTGQNSEHDFI
ncbi:hypothetical protein L208DRAFT_1407781, partial [Tricholoma matsutake]